MNNTPQSNIVSIIIPCFNEKDTIKKIINLIHKNNKFKKEIILVDDFSSDGTREIVKKFTKSFVDKVILHKFNKGKGGIGWVSGWGMHLVLYLDVTIGDPQWLVRLANSGANHWLFLLV